MSTISELEQQVFDLQARVAYQEDMLQDLNKTIAQQDQAIELFKLQFKRWQSKIDEMAYSIESSGDGGIEKPPHY